MTYADILDAVRADLKERLPEAAVFTGLEGNCWKYPPYEACIRLRHLTPEIVMIYVQRYEDGRANPRFEQFTLDKKGVAKKLADTIFRHLHGPRDLS